jgi:hypothetical protein
MNMSQINLKCNNNQADLSMKNDEQEIVYEEWMYDLTVADFVIAGLIPIDKAIS